MINGGRCDRRFLFFVSRCSLFYRSNSPEVCRVVLVYDVRIGHVEVALNRPIRTPGIADNEDLFCIIVTDTHYGMATNCILVGLREGHHTVLTDVEEVLVHCEAKYEWESLTKAALKLKYKRVVKPL